mgnify:FL=1|jgi:uncharacterized protein (DUF2249 family)
MFYFHFALVRAGSISNTRVMEININEIIGDRPVKTLDVRPILEKGTDPFQMIMAEMETLQPGTILLIINTFEPIPLINVLKSKGFDSVTVRPEPGVVHTYMLPGAEIATKPAEAKIYEEDINLLNEKKSFYAAELVELDVRDMEMPMPMASILQHIENLSAGQALFVYHKKFPQFLTDELLTRGFNMVSHKVDENNIQLIIYK